MSVMQGTSRCVQDDAKSRQLRKSSPEIAVFGFETRYSNRRALAEGDIEKTVASMTGLSLAAIRQTRGLGPKAAN